MIDLGIISVGLCTPLGLDRETTVREIAAGSDRFEETSVTDAAGAPVRACALSLLPRGATRTERMMVMAWTALDEPLAAAAQLGVVHLPFALGLPEPSGEGHVDVDAVVEAIHERAAAFGITLTLVPGGVRLEGRAAWFGAVRSVVSCMSSEQPFALVGAVDSRCDTSSLVHLASTGATLGSTNVQGMIPGEGAGFVLVSTSTGSPSGQPWPRLRAVATGSEAVPFVRSRERPSLSMGLTAVMSALRSDLRADPLRPERVLSCQTDASFWGTELVRAYLRNVDVFPEPLRIDLLSEALGDAGAAAAVIQLAVALHAAPDVGDGPSEDRRRALVYGCADTGPVGACCIECPRGHVSMRPERHPDVPNTWLDRHPELGSFRRMQLRDHVEDLGSLALQRGAILRAPHEPWTASEDLERRVATKVAALAVANEGARKLARTLLDEEDDEELRVGAVLVLAALGTQGDHEMLARRWGVLDEARLEEWSDALWLGLAGRGADAFLHVLAQDGAPWRQATLHLLECVGPSPRLEWFEILGTRVPGTPEHDALLTWFSTSADVELRGHVAHLAAAMPHRVGSVELLLRLGHPQAVPHLRYGLAHSTPLPEVVVLLAMVGDRHDFGFFASLQERAELDLLELAAIGIYGLASAVPVLLAAMERGGAEVRRAAALALHRMTGAGLREERWVEEGEVQDLLSEDADAWQRWWSAHGGRFDPRTRYRLGAPASPTQILEELLDPRSEQEQRTWACRELAIQRGRPLDLHLAWPVARQRRALARLAASLSSAQVGSA